MALKRLARTSAKCCATWRRGRSPRRQQGQGAEPWGEAEAAPQRARLCVLRVRRRNRHERLLVVQQHAAAVEVAEDDIVSAD